MALTDCIYCEGRSGDPSFTVEHIWPQALGGTYANQDVFVTQQVCRRCNSLIGSWVDGFFIKSWFVTLDRALSAHSHLDPTSPEVAPLVYHGFLEAFPIEEGYVCERWTGMAGESIYHVHLKDADRWSCYAGGNFFRRSQDDPGRVYFTLSSPEEYWSATAVKSIVHKFNGARIRCLTELPGWSGAMPFVAAKDPAISQQETIDIEWLQGAFELRQRSTVPMQIDFPERFQAKVALGLAHTILGPRATFSPYGDSLRKLLWSRSAEEREGLNLQGTGWWNGKTPERVIQQMSWPDAWTLYVQAYPTAYGAVVFTPGGRSISMMISNDPTTWKEDINPILLNGAIFIFVPQRRFAAGPIQLMDYISHRLNRRRHAQLCDLEALRSGPGRLPPKRVPGLKYGPDGVEA